MSFFFSSGNFDVIPDNAVAQYDATKISGNDGDSLSTFEDEGGTYPLSGTGTLRTGSNGIGGKNAVDVSGSNSFSETNLTQSQGLTIAAVIKDGSSTANELVGDQSDGRPTLNVNSGPSRLSEINAGTQRQGNATNSPEILIGLYDGANSEIRQNGTTTVTGDAGTQGIDSGLHISEQPNGRTGFDGLVGEVVIYDKILSSAEISSEETRLSDKWSITI